MSPSPSLKEIFDKKCPPETRRQGDDLEEMTFSRQRLGKKGPFQRYQGHTVVVRSVNLEADTHKVIIEGGEREVFTASNDADIYE